MFVKSLHIFFMLPLMSICSSYNGLNELLERTLAKKTCLLIFFNMSNSDIMEITSSSLSMYPILAYDQGTNNSWQWRSISPCFIGISHMTHIMGLQALLADVPNRRMILIKPHQNDNYKFSQKELTDLTSIDRRHHPPMILVYKNQGRDLLLTCRTFKTPELLKVDFWAEGRWNSQYDAGESNVEKSCNNGNNEMHGKTIVASVFGLFPRLVLLRQFKPPKLTGLVIDLTNVLAKQVGFIIRYKLTKTWGNLLPNGTLIGTRGDVENGHSDMGLEIVVNFPRGPGAAAAEGNISNTNFWTWRVINFLTTKPRQYPQWLNVMLPLDRTSWFFTLICLSIVSALFTWLSYRESPNKIATSFRAVDLSFMALTVFWLQYHPTWRAYHGNKYPSRVTKGSLMYLFWVVMAFLLIEFYRSNLKASLMVRSHEPGIRNIQEALDRDMPIHLQKVILEKFETFTDAQSIQVVEQVKQKGTVIPASARMATDTENAVLKHGGVGYMYDEMLVMGRRLYHNRGESYPLTFMDERYSTNFDGIVLPYQSPRLHILNPVIRRIYESGIIFALYNKYKLDMVNQEEEHDTQFENQSLRLGHLTIPIFASFIGWLLAVVMFLLEVWTEYVKYQRVKDTHMTTLLLIKSKTNYIEFAKLQ